MIGDGGDGGGAVTVLVMPGGRGDGTISAHSAGRGQVSLFMVHGRTRYGTGNKMDHDAQEGGNP
jgi:hypothetical protein